METEKILPPEEFLSHTPAPVRPPVVQAPPAPPAVPGVPSPKAQQWGVVISIVIIVLMIVIGAFYAWGERIAQENELLTPFSAE
ncbi:MAG: hypothetical protein WC814_00165 [Candidatus Paceibacterota bacterium]|jgi:hypothetical protein